MGEGKGAEGKETDEYASRSAPRQDVCGPRDPEARADAVASLAEQLHRWTATVCM